MAINTATIIEASLSHWSLGPDAASLASTAGQLVHNNPNASIADAVIGTGQALESLLAPLMLAVESPTFKTVAKTAGWGLPAVALLKDLYDIADAAYNPNFTPAERDARIATEVVSAFGNLAALAGVVVFAPEAVLLGSTLLTVSMGLSVYATILENNGNLSAAAGQLLASSWDQVNDVVRYNWNALGASRDAITATLQQLYSDVTAAGSNSLQVIEKFGQDTADFVTDHWSAFSGNPISYAKDSAGKTYAFLHQKLQDGREVVAKLYQRAQTGDVVELVFEPLKELFNDGSISSVDEIVVIAYRTTREVDVRYRKTGDASDWDVQFTDGALQSFESLGRQFLDIITFGEASGQSANAADLSYGSGLSSVRTSPLSRPAAPTPTLEPGAGGQVTIGGSIKGTVIRDPRLPENNNRGTLETENGVLIDVQRDPNTGKYYQTGWRIPAGDVEVAQEVGGPIRIKVADNPTGTDFADAGETIGSVFGRYLADGNELVSVVSSAALKTIGANLGDLLNQTIFGNSSHAAANISAAWSDIPAEFLSNLKSAGIGAVSAFLTAELINVLGANGFAGEMLNSAGGAVIGQVAANLVTYSAQLANGTITAAQVFQGVGLPMIGMAVGSFFGSKLANSMMSFDSVGGQIGAAVGSTLASIAAIAYFGGPVGLIGGFVFAFVGSILGGAIGSIFGGTPRSGADVSWDGTKGEFSVANVWSKKGGSKEAAKGVAQAVASTYNNVVSAIGGELLNPESVQAGNYGMRGSKFVYRPISSRDKDDITARFTGDDAPEDLINYGAYLGLSDPDFQIAGGDIYVKRAFYNSVAMSGVSGSQFEAATLLGDLSIARRFETFLRYSSAIGALIKAEPDSVFAAEWSLVLQRAVELGLQKRHASDWYGGFNYLLHEADSTAGEVTFSFELDPFSGGIARVINVGPYMLTDTIDVAGQDIIQGTASADTINLTGGQIADVRNLTVNGKVQNDIAVTGTDFTAASGTLSFAAGDLRQSFNITVANDGVAEEAETLLASLSNASAMTIMGGAATITVRNANAGVPQLLVGKSYAYEGDGYAVFRVSLSKAASGNVALAFTLADGRAAGNGVDYGGSGFQYSANGTSWSPLAGNFTMTAGMTQVYIRVPVKTDALTEGAEDFRLTATVTTGASYVATTTASNTGTILNGASATPLVWIDDVVVDEATGAATVTVSRNKTAATVNTVQYATQDRRTKTIGIAATVDGGAGNDRIDASDLGDNILGGAGDDTLYGGRLDDWLFGGDGNDILNAGAADTTKLGGDGNYLDGGAGNDTLTGREGSDWLEGGAGNDTLAAQGGDDILGGKGNMRWQNTFNPGGNRLALAWAANDNAPWGLRRAG